MSASVINLHDFVGEQPDARGMRSADFAALLAVAGEDVEIHINSSGGTVTEGFHMANLLRAHGGKTLAVIEGVCASAATFLAAACDRVEAYEAALIMVHGPWGGVQGNATKMRESADLLDKLAEGMASLYRRRGIPEDTIAKWLESEQTYFTPDEALAVGLIDAVIKQPSIDVPAARALLHQQVMAKMKSPPQSGRNPQGRATMTEEEKEKARAEAKAKVKAAKAAYKAEFGDEPSTTDEHKAKVRAEADEDAEVQAAKAALLTSTAKAEAVAKQYADKLAEIQAQQSEEEFAKFAADRLGADEAKELLRGYKHDAVRAKAFVEKLPKLNVLGRVFAGGNPAASGGKTPMPVQNTKTSYYGQTKVIQHGVQFAAMAQELADKGDAKIPMSQRIADAHREIARLHPNLVERE